MPMAVHLDHATTKEDIELALDLAEKGIAFDSIMVDASHADASLPIMGATSEELTAAD